MPLPRIYADFNAIEYLGEGSSSAEVPLTGYGTLASLARQKLRLFEGMAVLLYEPSDIECEAVVHFDYSRKDPAGRVGAWVARIADHRAIRDSKQSEEPSSEHPCIICGGDFAPQLAGARNYMETCIHCGASVMEPMAPPKSAA
jgi:hypothetical protein